MLPLPGAMHPIVPAPNAVRLAGQLADASARVTGRVLPTGHGFEETDVAALTARFASLPFAGQAGNQLPLITATQ